MRDVMGKVTLLILSSLLTVYVVNAAAAIWFPTVSPAETTMAARVRAAAALGVDYDQRTPAEVLQTMRAEVEDVVPLMTGIGQAAPSRGSGLLPLGGVPDVQTLFCNEGGYYVTYTSDEHGFRNPPGTWRQPRVDAALVGDSFAQGYCVQEGSDVAAGLRADGRTVVNLGMAGNGPLLNLASITEYATHLRPRRVYWLHFEHNDLRDLGHELRFPLLRGYLGTDGSQRLYERVPEINAYLRSQAEATEAAVESESDAAAPAQTLLGFLTLRELRLRLARVTYRPERCGELTAEFEQSLRLARDAIAEWQGELVFVYLPTYRRYYYPSSTDGFCHRNEIRALVDELDIATVDIHPLFAAHPDPLSLFPLRIKGHYTAEGYGMVAEAIRDFEKDSQR